MFIERQPIIDHFTEMTHESIHDDFDAGYVHGYETALEYIEDQDVADVEPIRRGEWIDESHRFALVDDGESVVRMRISISRCSYCKRLTERMTYSEIELYYDRCPHCGAIMKSNKLI